MRTFLNALAFIVASPFLLGLLIIALIFGGAVVLFLLGVISFIATVIVPVGVALLAVILIFGVFGTIGGGLD